MADLRSESILFAVDVDGSAYLLEPVKSPEIWECLGRMSDLTDFVKNKDVLQNPGVYRGTIRLTGEECIPLVDIVEPATAEAPMWRETDDETCPVCGEEQGDLWELGDSDGDEHEIVCGSCGASITVGRDVSVSYRIWATTPKPLQTCRFCGHQGREGDRKRPWISQDVCYECLDVWRKEYTGEEAPANG